MNHPLMLRSQRLLLRPAQSADVAPLATILAEPKVAQFWPDFDAERVRKELVAPDPEDSLTVLIIEHEGAVIGAIQFEENDDPQYRQAGIDLFIGSHFHGRGLGREAIAAVVDHLFGVRDHHRITIDPAAHNLRAIHAYERVGFQRVGLMRRYERGADGGWHDGLLMELLAEPAPHAAPRAIDVSHTVEHGLVTYRGLPAPIICDYLSREASRAQYAPGTEFHIGRIDMVANTGTYVDSPFHRYAAGKDLSELELARLANLDTVVLRAREGAKTKRAIDVEDMQRIGAELRGKAVLIDTGWDRHFGTDRYCDGHPFLTEAAARFLVAAGPALVGIDSLNMDDTADPRRPAHSLLLGAEIPIVEHLTRLEQLPDRRARFFAVPVKVRALGTFPVRAFALVD